MTKKSSNRDEVPHLLFSPGAGVTPAKGSVKPTAGFTFNKMISTSPLHLRDPLLRRSIASRYHDRTTPYAS
jgi:hypothetical protein